MSAPDPPRTRVTIHLLQQTTVTFDAVDMWPRPAADTDLTSFAAEFTHRMHSEGYIGFTAGPESITVIPLRSVKRVDFTTAQ